MCINKMIINNKIQIIRINQLILTSKIPAAINKSCKTYFLLNNQINRNKIIKISNISLLKIKKKIYYLVKKLGIPKKHRNLDKEIMKIQTNIINKNLKKCKPAMNKIYKINNNKIRKMKII